MKKTLKNWCVVISLVLTTTISGCASVPKISAACPRVPVPPPISERIYIRIEPGRVDANSGGERLLRNYAGMRTLIRSIWGD